MANPLATAGYDVSDETYDAASVSMLNELRGIWPQDAFEGPDIADAQDLFWHAIYEYEKGKQ